MVTEIQIGLIQVTCCDKCPFCIEEMKEVYFYCKQLHDMDDKAYTSKYNIPDEVFDNYAVWDRCPLDKIKIDVRMAGMWK